jgi:hypothetical protein
MVSIDFYRIVLLKRPHRRPFDPNSKLCAFSVLCDILANESPWNYELSSTIYAHILTGTDQLFQRCIVAGR